MVPKMDQRVKVRIGNRKVMEMKQGSLETKMGQGEVRIGVLVWGYTECNTVPLDIVGSCISELEPQKRDVRQWEEQRSGVFWTRVSLGQRG